MDCEWVRDRLAPGESRALNAASKAEIEAHLKTCPACAAHSQELDFVLRGMRAWQSQEVPEWRRLPLMPRREPRRMPLLAWLPLAASILILAFVVGRAQIRVTQAGWSLSFAYPAETSPQTHRPAIASQPIQSAEAPVQTAQAATPTTPVTSPTLHPALSKEELQQMIQDAIAAYEHRSEQRMNAMLAESSKSQRGEMGQWLKEALAQTQTGNERQLQMIFNQFNAQRVADLKALNEQFSVIYQNQDFQAKGLRTLNSMLTKQANYAPQ